MNSKNMNYAFQVEYQKQALSGVANNTELIQVLNSQSKDVCSFGKKLLETVSVEPMYFRTQYPGVLIGTGYPHETGKETGEIQVGFSFDYVTGAPYYPGSSLKGVIRNVFDSALQKNSDNLYMDYLQDILPEDVELNGKILSQFVEIAFGDNESDSGAACGNDIFYGGYVVGCNDKIIGIDSLTPHTKGPTKNPTPITMLRITPDVTIAFAIDIRNNNRLDKMKFSNKVRRNMYIKILEDFGIGAKRNVGYGNLIYEMRL